MSTKYAKHSYWNWGPWTLKSICMDLMLVTLSSQCVYRWGSVYHGTWGASWPCCSFNMQYVKETGSFSWAHWRSCVFTFLPTADWFVHGSSLSTSLACTPSKLHAKKPGIISSEELDYVNKYTSVPCTDSSVGQTMEHLNKITKGAEGISGIISTSRTLLKLCLARSELACLSEEEWGYGLWQNRSTVTP